MNRIGLFLLAGLLFFAAPLQLRAQTEDPSEVFLKAYMTSQQGEKLEHDNQYGAALAKFRLAGSLLDDLRKRHAQWQPAIVDYRARKIGESIQRVQGKAGTPADLAAAAQPPAAARPRLLPRHCFRRTPVQQSRVSKSAHAFAVPTAPQAEPARAAASTAVAAAPTPPPPSEAAIKEATKKLQEKVDQLQSELQKSRKEYSSVQKEKETLTDRLKETNSKLDKAQAELQKSRGAEKTVRDQLATAQESLKKIQSAGNTDAKAAEALVRRSRN